MGKPPIERADLLLVDFQLMTMRTGDVPYGLQRAGAVAIADGQIAWIGSRNEAASVDAGQVVDGQGRFLSPGLIDCHTHLIWAGSRADEWEQRLRGVSYEQLSQAGGGILATVRATRTASEQQLRDTCIERAQSLIRQGVTALEIKSGYGLDLESERKMLSVAGQLAQHLPVEVSRTLLAAHAVPQEYCGRSEAYVDRVCEQMIPQLADVCDAADVFCESIGFDLGQTNRVLQAARRAGLGIKVHAEQLSHTGAAKMAAELGAWSADHLEFLDEAGVRAMAQHQTVAVLLPGAFYFLQQNQVPPVNLLRKHGVTMAVASDANPGSSPLGSPTLAMNLACTLFGLTPEEAMIGFTRNAARALGWDDRMGTIEVGKQADLVIWDIGSPAELAYAMGQNPCRAVYKLGRLVFQHRGSGPVGQLSQRG